MKKDISAKQTKELLSRFDARRKALGLSHQTVADRAGIARSTVSLVMRQKTTPTIAMCFKIASALETTLESLLSE